MQQIESTTVSVTHAQLEKASARLLQAMNAAQFEDGHTIDEVLMAALYVVGAGIRRRCAVLLMDAPLKQALPPLVAGYMAEDKRLSQMSCRVCGCTEQRACVGGCYWIKPNLCSACGEA